MKNYQGVLKKMQTEYDTTVQYYLIFENDFLNVNQILDKKISINFLKFSCINCGMQKKVFRDGFCYNCFSTSAMTGEWIIRPELSRAHLGEEDRDLETEKKMQLQPHIVYLANSGDVKVGVTRKSNKLTRWIDQGAHEAIEILETPNRYLAGIAEVALKNHVSDKTNWKNMVLNHCKEVDLLEKRDFLKEFIPEEARNYFLSSAEKTSINFPVLQYPLKCKSLGLIKNPFYEGVLKGIKGQYLIFEDGMVFNIRNHEGYEVDLRIF
ncbi:MAG TPA: DUF2797 domain-containing protein [Salinimicrobium sp.]|nr:DUF2797 domain-containing protein [Salinimicrobium sp.]